MNQRDYMKLICPSYACNEAFARSAVGCFVAQLYLTLDELGEIRASVSEAVSNCTVHAYPNETGLITVQCLTLENGEVTIVVRDNGIGIEALDKAHKQICSVEGTERSGMGFEIMKRFMTKLSVTSKPGKGTAVYMTKKVKQKNK